MTTKPKIIILIIATALVAGLLIFKFPSKKTEELKNIKTEEQETEEPAAGIPPDYIVVKDTPEGKIVENTKVGVSMKIPEGWEVNEYVSDEDIEIRKFGPGHVIETDLIDGSLIKLYVKENPENLNVKEWILKNWGFSPEELFQETVDDIEIIKTTEKVESGIDEYDEPVYQEKAEEISYTFTENRKVYRFSCITEGSRYKEYSQECGRIIKNKIRNKEF